MEDLPDSVKRQVEYAQHARAAAEAIFEKMKSELPEENHFNNIRDIIKEFVKHPALNTREWTERVYKACELYVDFSRKMRKW